MQQDTDARYVPGPLVDRFQIRLFSAAVLQINPRWNSRQVRSTYWRLYVSQGAGASVRWAGGEHALTPRRVHLIPAWVMFDCHCTRTVGHLYLHFDWTGLSGERVRQWFGRPVALPSVPVLSALTQRLRAELAGQGSTVTGLLLGKALACAALGELVATLDPVAQRQLRQGVDEQTPLWPALRHIEAHLAQRTSNDELAHVCHLSTTQFIRRFRQTMGQTPARYALERRLGEAVRRMLASDDSLDAIADATGFANRFHFTRAFTRIMGVSPARYRRTRRV